MLIYSTITRPEILGAETFTLFGNRVGGYLVFNFFLAAPSKSVASLLRSIETLNEYKYIKYAYTHTFSAHRLCRQYTLSHHAHSSITWSQTTAITIRYDYRNDK